MTFKGWLARWAKQRMAEEKQEVRERILRLFDEAMGEDDEASELMLSVIATSKDKRRDKEWAKWAACLLWMIYGVRELPAEGGLERQLEERIGWRKTE